MASAMPMMPTMGAPAGGQNIVYHIYQIPAPAAPAKDDLGCTFVCGRYLLRPFLSLCLWSAWVIYIAGIAQVCDAHHPDSMLEHKSPLTVECKRRRKI